MTTAKRSLRPTSKTAWAQANDAGPHLAVLPTKKVVRFRIPDSAALLRSGRLPENLREAAIIFSSHPDGTDELMRELVIAAALRGPGQETLSNMIQAGTDLTPHLIAEMLVEPEVTPEEVASGMFHELDIRMLLEFAERLRNVDAAGNTLPIIVLDEWATFRRQPQSTAGTGAGGDNGAEPAGDVPDPDAGDV
jgi:hypothetical protein